jgi:hypothetical protein
MLPRLRPRPIILTVFQAPPDMQDWIVVLRRQSGQETPPPR